MTKPYIEVVRSAKYKLTGSGSRNINMLLESLAGIDPSTEADGYGNGAVINNFEAEVASLLGKESAVFFPSGTMAQQIAMRIWCDRRELKKVAYHPLCHLEIHEQGGMRMLHQLEPILLGEQERLFTLEDVKSVQEPIAALLIELPQREIGGQLPAWEELLEISAYCKANDIKLHLDGARLFEVLPYYGKSPKEVCSLFDSVYVSFYKGLGGIAGAILAGNHPFTEEAKIWKRRHGGDLISLYPYILSAKHYMDKRMGKMGQYWWHAQTVAERLNKMKGVKTIPEIPVCNMFHAYFNVPKAKMEDILTGVIEKYNLALITNLRETDDAGCKSELSFGDNFSHIPHDVFVEAMQQLAAELNSI